MNAWFNIAALLLSKKKIVERNNASWCSVVLGCDTTPQHRMFKPVAQGLVCRFLSLFFLECDDCMGNGPLGV